MSGIDAVLSYHMNPATCGVAKFNHALAKRLGVPCLPLGSQSARPLVSVKFSELNASDVSAMKQWQQHQAFDLFAHDRPSEDAAPLVNCAERVFYADEVGCPSTIDGNPTRGVINVLTFGMAHKLQTARYEKLKSLLDDQPCGYTVSVSTAIHEGSPWDETALVADRLREVFGSHLRVLGYLADDALAKELRDCTAVALFFDPALRANNTTAWAALDAHKPLITNYDAHSPSGGVCIDKMNHVGFQEVLSGHFKSRFAAPTWDGLLQVLA